MCMRKWAFAPTQDWEPAESSDTILALLEWLILAAAVMTFPFMSKRTSLQKSGLYEPTQAELCHK